MITQESEKKIKKYMDELENWQPLPVELVWEKLSPLALPYEEGGQRLTLMMVYYSSEGWAAATNGYAIGFLPVDVEESFGVQSTVDKHKTDEIKVSPKGIEVICNHKNDKTDHYTGFDLEVNGPPDYYSILPEIDDCAAGNSMGPVKGEFIQKLAKGVSNEGIELLPEESSESILAIGKYGFGIVNEWMESVRPE